MSVRICPLRCSCDSRGVEVCTFIPVEEAFEINHVANLQSLNSFVDIGVVAAEIELHAERIGLTVCREVKLLLENLANCS